MWLAAVIQRYPPPCTLSSQSLPQVERDPRSPLEEGSKTGNYNLKLTTINLKAASAAFTHAKLCNRILASVSIDYRERYLKIHPVWGHNSNLRLKRLLHNVIWLAPLGRLTLAGTGRRTLFAHSVLSLNSNPMTIDMHKYHLHYGWMLHRFRQWLQWWFTTKTNYCSTFKTTLICVCVMTMEEPII